MNRDPGGVSEPDTPPPTSTVDPAPLPGGARAATTAQRVLGILVTLIAFWTVIVLPLRVISVGYRPTDDARRHVAKVLSGKAWSEILVLRPEATVDSHPGWHALLSTAKRAGVTTGVGLIVVSSVALGTLFLMAPLLLRFGREEAWLLALLVTAVGTDHLFRRIFIGRPFVFAMSVLVALAVLWPRLRGVRTPRGPWIALAALFSLSVWIHGSWYLWALPLAAFAVAGEFRVAARVGTALVVGTLAGAALTGSPVEFLGQTLRHPLWAIATDLPKRVLVFEFQPFDGEPWMVAATLALIAWRRARSDLSIPLANDPVFVLAAAGWALGFHTQRFWWDWGLPACMVWMAKELDVALARIPRYSRRRLWSTVAIAAVLFLAVTNDRQSRWSSSESSAFLSRDNAEHRAWLPAPGGVLYSNDMRVFYNTFWRNPQADWRYVLGFEPALMPLDDLAVYRRIQLEYASEASFAPWVAKLRPADRLIVVRSSGGAPRIPVLEWHSPYRGMWIGRLPANGASATPTRTGSAPPDMATADPLEAGEIRDAESYDGLESTAAGDSD